ncbi:MAG: hypothetical protein EBQ96_09380 [Proteobacteria bacterium]|nr:hypothetical protein [Pseudomonadota bacterium]
MSAQDQHNNDEADLEGFESPEEDFDQGSDPDAVQADADDADFQDVSDDIDTDVFGEEQPSDQPVKKKTNWFNIGVAVVAVAVAGGLIWTKLGPQIMGGGDTVSPVAGASAPANPVATPVTKAGSEAAAQAAIGGGATAPAGAGLLDNPDQFANLNQAPQPDAPAPVLPSGNDPFAALGDVQAAPLPMPAPISGTPVAVDASSSKPQAQAAVEAAPAASKSLAAVETMQPQAAAMPVATANTTSGLEAGDTEALKAQVSTLEQKLEALDSKITAAVEQMGTGAASAPAPVDDARLSSIQSSLERLEARLDDLSSKREAAPRSVSMSDDVTPAPKKTSKKSTKTKGSSPSRSQSQWDQPYTPPTPQSVMAQPVASNNSTGWELRGAQTGRAVIARGSDLREVSVGESVPGLGEITGVANMGGRWVVQGTQGRLSQ